MKNQVSSQVDLFNVSPKSSGFYNSPFYSAGHSPLVNFKLAFLKTLLKSAKPSVIEQQKST